MIKLFIGAVIGFAVFYLYQNPGDITGLIDTAKATVNSSAQTLVDITKDKFQNQLTLQ